MEVNKLSIDKELTKYLFENKLEIVVQASMNNLGMVNGSRLYVQKRKD